MRANLFPGLGLVALILGGCGSTGAVEVAEVREGFGMEAVLSREFARAEPEVLARIVIEGTAEERERAAYALGRFAEPSEGTIAALIAACSDDSVAVKVASRFSLGLLEVDYLPGALVLLRESHPELQARGFEAIGRHDDDLSRQALLRALEKKTPANSPAWHEIVLATANWSVEEESADYVDERLVKILQEQAPTEAARRELERGEGVEFVWRILFALQRRNAARLRSADAKNSETALSGALETNALARASFLLWARSTDARARIYAVQGLGTLKYDEAVTRELHHALKDDDWRVVCDACVALGREVTVENLQALIAAAKHANPHVRRVAIESLGEYLELREQISRTLDATNADPSSSVQAAAIVTAAKLYGEHSAAQLELKRLKQDPVIRAGVAEAARYLPSELALPLIRVLAQDSNLRVAGFALESLGAHKTEESRMMLREYLQHDDYGLRLMALIALKEMLIEEDLPFLVSAFEDTTGDNIADEFRFNVVKAAATFHSKLAERLLFLAAGSEDDYTSRLARMEEKKRGVIFIQCFGSDIKVAANLPILPDELIALATATENPFVLVETTRGTMVFELFPRETPFHVYNFIELARRGHYDNLDFHRVVPNFVVQGGDTRGDGNGGTTWRGGSLPAEFTPRKYIRGSLGMPRNEDPDSGGSQFFVTHRATPHLDGRYTIFGELREGFDVLDRIEVGDRILHVAVE